MADYNWEPAEQAAKNEKGEYMGLINGKWEPVHQAAKDENGKFMVLRSESSPEAKQEAGPKVGALDYVPAVPVGETALALGSGTAGAVAGGLAGIAGTILPGEQGQGAQWAQAVQGAMQYEPKTASGQKMTRAVTYLPEKLGELTNETGARVTDATGSPLAGAGANVALNLLPALIGKGVNMGARALNPRVAAPALEAAGKSGYAVTPDEAGAGAVGSTAASLSGEAKLAKNISNKNQPLHVEKISRDLELPKGTELNREALEDVRDRQGKAYEAIRKSGTVTVDDTFRSDLEKAVSDIKTASQDFDHRKASPLLEVVKSLSSKDSFDASSAVSEIKNLRKDAKKAFRGGDQELGIGSLDAAKALEDILDRHVEKLSFSGEIDPAAMESFKKARVLIAKSYAADKALRGTEIDPQAYAKMLENKVPLTGGAKEVAEFARDFPRSAQKPSHMAIKGPDWSDVIVAGMSGGKSLLKEAALMGMRPTARAALASDAYQALQRNPDALRGAIASEEFDKGSQIAAMAAASLEKRRASEKRGD